ncbi:MAG: hypothetical protein HY665_05515 [Chloroflexi bacterium]|nr:hypothetical protein [Chloroflexota bacterium]
MKNRAARKLKQIPAGYLAIGVDPHKKKHAAVAITEDLTVRTKFKFANSRAGFEQALERARTAVDMMKSLQLPFSDVPLLQKPLPAEE